MKNREQKLTISALRNYLDEWFNGTMSLAMSVDGRDDIFNFLIVNSFNGEVIFSTIYDNHEYSNEDEAICSTSGIVNEELRGIIEKCIMLDKQVESLKKAEANSKNQKGE